LQPGPLLTALFISRYGGIGVIHSYINNGAVYFMKDMGICMFFAAVGIHAGESFYANFLQYNGWLWIYYGCFITLIPLFIMVLIGRFAMKLNFYQLVGLMSGHLYRSGGFGVQHQVSGFRYSDTILCNSLSAGDDL